MGGESAGDQDGGEHETLKTPEGLEGARDTRVVVIS